MAAMKDHTVAESKQNKQSQEEKTCLPASQWPPTIIIQNTSDN